MMVDRAGIERRLPHGPGMCLLDGVARWDPTSIQCTAAAPGPGHPLARGGRVPAVAVIEYAAQASAVHGALLAGQACPRPGVLAKLSGVELHADDIGAGDGPLEIRVELLGESPAGCMYSFDIAGRSRQTIVSGRLIVAFTPTRP